MNKFPDTILRLSDSALRPWTKFSPTDHGLCAVINGNSMNNTFVANERTEVFSEYLDNRTIDVTPMKIKVGNRVYINKAGFGLNSIQGSGGLQKTVLWVNVRNPADRSAVGVMKVAFNDWVDFTSVRQVSYYRRRRHRSTIDPLSNFSIYQSHGLYLPPNCSRLQDLTFKAGTEYRLRIVPQVHTVSDSFKDLPLETRRCRFMQEVPEPGDAIFQLYRYKSCILNCMLKNLVMAKPSFDIWKCFSSEITHACQQTCIPWDYPKPKGAQLPHCHAGGNETTSIHEFDKHMSNAKNTARCETQCLPNCEETTYDYSISVSSLSMRSLCQKGKDTREE